MSNQYVKSVKDIDRFSSKIKIDEDTECWIWTGCTFGDGYGAFYYSGNNVRAHRFSYEHFKGLIPEGLLVCHIPPCHNPLCVNPKHLKVGTPQENMDDKVFEGRESHGGGKPSRLSESDVQEIIKMYRTDKCSPKYIATVFRISSCYVCNIVSGKRLQKSNGIL